jgi:hypothetical protein
MCPADTIREHIYAEKLRQLRQQLVCRNGDRHSLALAVPISVSGKPNVAHATRIVHSSRPFALRDFLQANISTVNAIRFCFLYWPARPRFSHDSRTIGAGYSRSCREPPDMA